MRITCLGGAGEIGANSYFLESGTRGLLLDCGLHPKKAGAAALPLLSAIPDEPDHILVTHAHLDHVGALPLIARRFHRARIHMTPTTRRFALRMLRNTVNVMRRRPQEAPAGAEAEAPLYDLDAVERLDDIIEEHDLLTRFPLGGGVEAVFHSAGHIPGAAGLLIVDGGRAQTLFYTGDTCGRSQLLIPPARYPERATFVLSESTYGGNPHADAVKLSEQVSRLGKRLAATIEQGGIALIPCFALGRSQEILFAVHLLKRKGRVPRHVPVYLTGLSRAFSQLYDQTRRHTPRRDPDLRLLLLEALPLDDVEGGVLSAPAIIIASSGMVLPHTMSSRLARRVLPDKRSAICVVGYNDPDTPGARILKSQPGEHIDLSDGEPPVPRQCQIERFYFSAHSTRQELLHMLGALQPERVVLVHGDPGSSLALADLDAARAQAGHLLPQPGVPYEL